MLPVVRSGLAWRMVVAVAVMLLVGGSQPALGLYNGAGGVPGALGRYEPTGRR